MTVEPADPKKRMTKRQRATELGAKFVAEVDGSLNAALSGAGGRRVSQWRDRSHRSEVHGLTARLPVPMRALGLPSRIQLTQSRISFWLLPIVLAASRGERVPGGWSTVGNEASERSPAFTYRLLVWRSVGSHERLMSEDPASPHID